MVGRIHAWRAVLHDIFFCASRQTAQRTIRQTWRAKKNATHSCAAFFSFDEAIT